MTVSLPGGALAPSVPLIAADIGGTNARFAWVEAAGGLPEHVRNLRAADYEGPGQAMQAYLEALPASCRHRAGAEGLQAGWAVAAVVGTDRIELTNNHWRFSRSEEMHRLGLSGLHLFNDFEALACALPHLQPGQWRSWDGRRPSLQGALAVVGPGTGLGVATMVRTPLGWQALPGEGGHMTLSAADDFEAEVLRLARQQFPHVSAERLLSGLGLPLLHRCVALALGAAPHDDEWGPETIVTQGLAGHPVAQRTLEVFCAMLGSFTGNVALVTGAQGGVFVGGGIVPRLGEFFFQSEFRRRFEAKGRFAGFLSDIPTVLITDTMVALRGVSAAVAQVHTHQAYTG